MSISTTYTVPPVTWAPDRARLEASRMHDFLGWLERAHGLRFDGFRPLWRWSIDDVSAFWDAVREYFDVLGDGFAGPALAEDRMPGAVWYPAARLSFAENVLRPAGDPTRREEVAITEIGEDDAVTSITWAQLEAQVASVAAWLRAAGVREGDRVAAVLPNVPEAIVGLLAAASVGAVWSVCSPELSVDATLSRLAQLEPVVLLGVTGYRFNGRAFDRAEHLRAIEAGLPTVRRTVVVASRLADAPAAEGADRVPFADLLATPAEPSYVRVPFAHPLWVLFSSGTTGAPKGIVHGHGGMLLEALKMMGLTQDLGPGDVYYVAANTSWMVWNTLVNTLATGASVICSAGSPTFGGADRQFRICARAGVTMFATGAAYLALVERSGLEPGAELDLGRLKNIMSTGSPLPESTWLWVHRAVRAEVHLGSDSGGTDICSGFIGSNPLEPVRLGELQGPELGAAVEAWDEDGRRIIGGLGEMVVLRPMPSMPLFLWGDTDGALHRAAYFERYPGVWTHGDWVTETPSGGFLVHGRSDATLNRAGVRLGSAELYGALQHVPEVVDGLAIGVDGPDGDYWFPLFVVLADGEQLDDRLRDAIVAAIREHASARHVPDTIEVVPAIPVTFAGKKIEVQIKKLFAGIDPERALSRGALANPGSVEWFVDRARTYREARA